MRKLPPLAFGNHVNLNSARELIDVLTASGSVRRIQLPDAPRDFIGLMAMTQVGDLSFGAFAHTPVTVETGDAPGHTVMIPVFGNISFTHKNRHFTSRAGHSLALLAEQGHTVATTQSSLVTIPFDKHRLTQTAITMLGFEEGYPIELNLDQAREVSTRPLGLPMGTALNNLFQMLNSLHAANLSLLNLDDLFYRSLAVMLNLQVAQVIAHPAAERRSYPIRREIRVVCEYIQAHLTEPVSLTDLERVSGLSARSLQLGFQQQFQCSPMQWLRRERFALARHRLLTAVPRDSVTTIALGCGFTQLGAFSQGYRAMFGETPAATLRRTRQRN